MRATRTFAKWLAACVLIPAFAWAQAVSVGSLAPEGAVVSRDPATGRVGFLGTANADTRLSPALVPGNPAANAEALLSRFASDFGVSGSDHGTTIQRVRSGAAGSAVRFQQTFKGLPVFAGNLVVNTDSAGALRAIAGKTTDKNLDTAAGIPASAASDAAMAAIARKYNVSGAELRASTPQLWVYDPRLLGLPARNAGLVWRTTVTSGSRSRISEVVLVDAAKGSIALAYSQVHRARNRSTYDTNSTSNLPGTLQCTEGTDPCTAGAIPDADNAHQYAADVYDFYFTRFGRDGIDGLGSPIVSTVRYCDPGECPMLNAFWTDELQQMVYGAGMVIDDVAGHEITHGITAHESGLIYFGESGAINESLSDIFGEFVDQVNGHGDDSPAVKWLMGEGSPLGVIRSMSNPPAFGDPDRKLSPNWYAGGGDEGGVHINSGVGNKAAFLIVDGGTFNGRTVTGIGLEKAAQIYYEAQTMLLTSGSNYADLYNALFQACTNLTGQFGITASNCTQVRTATQAVEMNLTAMASTAVANCPAGGGSLQVLGFDDFETAGASGSLNRMSVGTRWFLDSSLSTSGTFSALAQSVPVVSDSSLVYQIAGTIAVGDRILFNHTLDTEYRYDGAVVEYSINGGATWVDSRPLRVGGQDYNATIVASTPFANNPLYPRPVFTGFASSWLYTLYDLSALAGKSVQWRFRAGTDGAVAYYGWNIDDVYHYRCSAGDIALTSAAQAVSESVGSAIVTVSRGDGAAGAATVTYATSNGSAIAGIDYTNKTGTLTWAAGDAHPKTISIPIMNRAGTQPDRSFTLTLTGATGGTLGAPAAQTITIGNFDGQIQFSAPAVGVAENGPNVTLTVTRTGFAGPAASVTWTTAAQTATATTDFTTKTGTLTWEAGDSSPRTITIGPVAAVGAYVPIVNDATIEAPEAFLINLTAPTGAVLGATSSATVTITSDDAGITMAAAAMSPNESDGAIQILANRAGPSTGAVSVNYTITNGTAIRGTHFNSATATGTLNWPDGDSTPKAIDVTLVNDAAINTNRTFTVTLSGASGATLAAPMSTMVTIKDDDNLVQFYAPTQAVAENVGGGVVTIQLTRTGVITGPADVTWTTSNLSALAGTDFGALGNVAALTGTVSWAAGIGGSKTFTIPILNNATVNGSRSFSVQLSSPVGPGVGIGGLQTVTVTINDDEKAVQFLPPATPTVIEGASVVLTVQRIGVATAAATATWTTVNGSAISGTDFGLAGNAAPRTGTISWAMNDAANKTITIPTLNNATGGQPNRIFQVTLTPGAGIVLGATGTATVTIQDDDITPQTTVQFSQPKYNVIENVGNAVLTLTRTDLGPGCGLQSQVNFATMPGAALATSDYTTKTGTVTWAPGDGCVDKQITVAIVNNAVAEPPESFTVVLSGNSPGTNLGTPSTTTVAILDDDELFPAQCAMPAGFSTPGGVTAGWHVTSEPGPYEGACALRTDQIDDGESAGLEMAGTFVAGNVTFRVKVSSEPTFDKLTFFVDGAPQPLTWSGTTVAGWTASPTYPLSAGVHALRWVYQKDASASVGMDAAFIDGLVTPAFTP